MTIRFRSVTDVSVSSFDSSNYDLNVKWKISKLYGHVG